MVDLAPTGTAVGDPTEGRVKVGAQARPAALAAIEEAEVSSDVRDDVEDSKMAIGLHTMSVI